MSVMPFKKGDGRSRRRKGSPSKATRVLKKAFILAAEQSKHSKSKDLAGYCLYLADEKPELFVMLLARLMPLPAKIKTNAEAADGAGNASNNNMNMPELMNELKQRIKSMNALRAHDERAAAVKIERP